jgi:hypothetical protein
MCARDREAMTTTTTHILPAEDELLRKSAVERLNKRQDFRAHLLVYTLVNTIVWVTWALVGTGFPWPLFLSAFWAVGLIMNAYDVYARRPITEAEIRQEIERLRGA